MDGRDKGNSDNTKILFMKKNKSDKKHIESAAQKGIAPEWLLWIITGIWAVFVLKNYYSLYKINFDALGVMLGLDQYLNIFNFGNMMLVRHFLNVLIAALFIFSAFGAGRTVSGLLKIKWFNACEEIVFSTGLGFGIIAMAVFLLGIFSLLYASLFIILFICFSVAGAVYLKKYPPGRIFPKEKLSFIDIIALGIFFIAVVVNLAGALGPETFYDALVYHLGAPNFFKINHKIIEMPYVLYSNLPLNHGMLFTAGLLIKDEYLAKLINYSAGIFCCLAIFSISIRYFSMKTGIWAALIFYTIAQVMMSSWACGTETTITLFAILSLYGIMIYREKNELNMLVVSAIFSGLAMGVKYTGIFIAIGVIFTYIVSVKRISPKILRDLILWGFIASIVLMPWLVKNYVYKNNPVYPFMDGIFKTAGYFDAQKIKGFFGETKQYNFKSFGEWLTHPWSITMGKIPNAEYFTPVFLLVIPLLFFLGRPHDIIKSAIIFSLVVWITWSLSTTMIRFLMPAFPLLGLIIAWYLLNCRYGSYKNALLLVILFVCLTGVINASFVYYMQGGWRVTFGQQNKDEFLSSTHSGYPYGYYAAVNFINKNLPEDSKVLFLGESRSFYINRMPVVSSVFDVTPIVEWARQSKDGMELYKKLKSEGITHLFINLGEAARLVNYKIFYFDDRSIGVFNEFWDKYVEEIFYNDETTNNNWVNRVCVYRLLSENELSKPHKVPMNLMQQYILKRKPA